MITQISKVTQKTETLKVYHDTQIAIKYRDTAGDTVGNKTVNVDKLTFDLTAGYNEQILAGSVRLMLGHHVYVDKLGQIYRHHDNNSTLAGEINYANGEMTLSTWQAEQENRINLQSLATSSDTLPINHVCFRTPTIPLRVGSFTMTINTLEHGRITLKANEQGVIQHEKAIGKVSYDTGFVDVHFIQKTLITPDNHAEIKAKDWYHADLEYQDGGKTYINVPIWVIADSVRYNAISYSYIPLDKDVLGLSATRLPLDGRVPIFRVGDIGVICAEKRQELNEPIAGKQFTLQDQRLSFVEIVDSVGTKLDPTLYTVDYEQGTLTLGGDFTIGRLQPPLTAVYRYQDMGLIRDVQINGQISFTKPVTHDYSPEHSIVGSALIIGDMYARYANKFEQVTWNAKWENVSTDESLSANYNDALYPIVVTNKGAIQERWALVFTDNTNFRIIGETSGLIGIGNINEDCSPINPITQVPYFTINKDGWGSGWTNGNTLRFNTHASMYPIWCIRTVKQSEPTTLSDQFQLMLRGDIDR
ncbi:hypothetical protein [Moraxella sp. ZY210820]|uniref:hypothetical protein n=1 Tax=Moraxella sp. ZY210820 TaxID=2904123 RepID=UPI0027318145|nr:hypothetical protein [Moraxella sp. ZY210820]WLF84850.1 hypothetical protein LU301_05135 [Moraxella sp. ZY210820]